MNKAKLLTYAEIQVGQEFSFTRKISDQDGSAFAELSGDFNPLHVDEEFAKASPFGNRVVHGMLASALFSRLVGMECPGIHCLYLSQTLNFKKPIFFGDTVKVQGTVTSKADSIQVITIKTEIIRDAETVIDGVAKAKVLK